MLSAFTLISGASIGVDRLAALLEMADAMPEEEDGPVFVSFFDKQLTVEYQKIAYEYISFSISSLSKYCFVKR